MMLALVLLTMSKITIVASQKEAEDLPSFTSFIAKHSRTYTPGTDEYKSRQALFEKRVAEVKRHNSQRNQPWTASVNHLADRTEEELSQLRGWKGFASAGRSVGRVGAHAHGSRSRLFLGQSEQAVVPDNHTWESLEAIKADVDQGACGSCWAIATMTMMNAADEISGKKRKFSVQDLVNCVPNPHSCGGTGGCQGATVELAMNYIASKGLRTQDESPYSARDGQCQSSLLESSEASKSAYDFDLEAMIAIGQHDTTAGTAGKTMGLNFWTRLPENEYLPLLTHLVQHGPLAVSVAASGWNAYGDGIFNACSVDAVIDHAVVLFGYGVDKERGMKFWDIKNSWGKYWGRDGNIRLLREDNVKCGIDRQPEVGTGCDGGPSEVKVCGMCGILYDVVSVSM
mmetsp:Transcript_135300/g.234097  ORF Transcript_135300/g.234097 Transcript_135300/m.234097 type:complete len:399 (+) Transcript_135300:82-1278(+)